MAAGCGGDRWSGRREGQYTADMAACPGRSTPERACLQRWWIAPGVPAFDLSLVRLAASRQDGEGLTTRESRRLLIGETCRRIVRSPGFQSAEVLGVEDGALPSNAYIVIDLGGGATSYHHSADPGQGEHIPHGVFGGEFVLA